MYLSALSVFVVNFIYYHDTKNTKTNKVNT